MRRRLALLLLVVLAGCGGGSDYERRVSALCRDFEQAAASVEPGDARSLSAPYARLGDGLARLSPPDGLRRSHDAVLGLARAGEQVLAELGRPGGPRDGRDGPISEGAMTAAVEDLPRIERDLPACADALTATHPEIQVIR